MRDVLQELEEAIQTRRPVAYTALVETRGSTPQKPGATMLVFPDGSQAGTLGGGCVEAEVKRQALRTLTGDPAAGTSAELFTFCLDDNYGWDDGLICGGRMSILADPLLQQAATSERGKQVAGYFRSFQRMVDQGSGCTEAVITHEQPVGVPVGSRYLFDSAGQLVERLGPAAVPEMVHQHLVPLQKRPRAYLHQGIAY